MARKLTSKQERYKNNRISGMGVSASYRSAYDVTVMSPQSISAAAAKLEKDDRIAIPVREARCRSQNDAVMTREEALKALSNIARTSVKDVVKFGKHEVGEEDGNPVHQTTWELLDDDEMDDSHIGAISELTAGRDGFKFKLHSQVQAIKQLGEMQGWEAPKKVASEINITSIERKIIDSVDTDD